MKNIRNQIISYTEKLYPTNLVGSDFHITLWDTIFSEIQIEIWANTGSEIENNIVDNI